jgi:hypothetical protein
MRMIARGCGRWIIAGLLVITTAEIGGAGPLHPAASPVPPTLEIEVLDPGVDPSGNPRALVRPGVPGFQNVDVPATVLVHKFYYTGDRSFQAQMLTGGPVIVAVSHPKTMERVYVPLILPPGAPRVSYTSHAIRYDYGPQSVTLVFGVCGKPNVVYSQANQGVERTKEVVQGVATGTRNWVQRTGIPQGLQRFAQGTKSAVGAGADAIHDVGRAVLLPVANGLRSLPGAQFLKSTPEDQAANARVMAQRQAEQLPPNLDQAFVPRGP